MNPRRLLCFASLVSASALAQGPLTPPGAPAPTMKSLDQIQPRTPLVSGAPGVSVSGSGTITVSQPGSYYLTGNHSVSSGVGISVSTSNVTLDLGGFSIDSNNSGTTAIISSQNNVIIRNGIINRWTSRGIELNGIGCQVNGVTVSNIGQRAMTISGRGTVIDSCVVHTCGNGIDANTQVPNSSIVTRCHVHGITQTGADAVSGISAGSVSDCSVKQILASGTSASTRGIQATDVHGCTVSDVQAVAGLVVGIGGTNVSQSSYTGPSSPVAGSASHYGILTATATACSVRSHRMNSSGSFQFGISASNAEGCIVDAVINTGTGVPVVGIGNATLANFSGSSLETAIITRCNVSGITGAGSAGGTGIRVQGHGIVSDCRAAFCSATGIALTNGAARNNTTYQNTGTGLSVSAGLATGNTSIGDTTAFSLAVGVRSGPVVSGGGPGTTFDVNSNFDL